MSRFKAFLNPTYKEKTQKVVISDRFVDEDGNPEAFEIRTISQQVNNALIKKFTKEKTDKKGNTTQKLDNRAYANALIVACTIYPDFADSEICNAYGTMDPNDVPERMLLAGEYAQLTSAVMELNNFKGTEEILEEAKN